MIHFKMKKKTRLGMNQLQVRPIKDSIRLFLGSSLIHNNLGKNAKEQRVHFLKEVLDLKFLESDLLS